MNFNIGKKAAGLIAAVLLGSTLLTACSEGDLAAKVNGEGITMEEYNSNLDMRKNYYISQYGEETLSQDIGDGMTVEEMLAKETIDSLVHDEVILQDAKERDIKVSKDEFNKKLEEFKTQAGGEEEYKAFLEDNKIDEKFFEDMLEENLIMEAHGEAVKKELKVSEDAVKDYYEQNKEYLSQVKASHILIGVETAEGATEEEIAQAEETAKSKAVEISDAIKNGAKFEDYIAESTEPGAVERKGDLGYFGKGQMVPEFEEVAFAMKEGEISEPVKTQFGYHIIKLVDKKETLEDVKSDIENTLKEQDYREYLDKISKEAEVEMLIVEDKSKDEKSKTEDSTSTDQSDTKSTDTKDNTDTESTDTDSADQQ